jgi:hypothetical protein
MGCPNDTDALLHAHDEFEHGYEDARNNTGYHSNHPSYELGYRRAIERHPQRTVAD